MFGMKKIYDKINNKQWRMTIPNINVVKKNPNAKHSGSYDIQEAEKEYEKTRSVNSAYFVGSNNSEFHYEQNCDENMMMSSSNNGTCENYAENRVESYAENDAEYDVPRISFKFFEKRNGNCDGDTYENTKNNDCEEHQNDAIKLDQDTNYEVVNRRPSLSPKLPRMKSEVKIVLTAVEIDIGEENATSECDVDRSRSPSKEFVSSTSIHLNTLRKCGSYPNINCTEDEENFYKVPRSLKSERYSQSLSDFSLSERKEINSSIEHVSCSQIINLSPTSNHGSCISEPTVGNNEFDYTRIRSRFPRLTLLKKPHGKWHNWKTKFQKKLIQQAAHQRVGAFEDKSKVINVEEVYEHSKSRCKTLIKNTGKIFRNKKSCSTENSEISSLNESKIKTPVKTEFKASDIEYKLNLSECSESRNRDGSSPSADFGTIKSTFGKIKTVPLIEGQNGFDDLRRYVKQGSDFCKELATILQDRAEAEAAYARSLSKLSTKLSRACREGVGTLNEGWKAVAQEMEARSESHRLLGVALLEESAKPLKTLSDNQQKNRKHAENAVDKAAKSLAEWRAGEAKSKKNSHSCARENEKLQDAAILDNARLSRSTSLIHLSTSQKNTPEKESSKLEGKKRKAEEAVKKADIEYYTLCVRAERARLEWESAVMKGVDTFQSLEEERLNNMKNALTSYLKHSSDHTPRLIEAIDRMKVPIAQSESTKDLSTFVNLRQTSHQISEQLLPDFYCEHITLAMNRERRKQALVKLLHLIRQDIERERKSKSGLENLSRAIKQTPNFGSDDSQQSVTEKLYHMKSMLTYLEAARYKVQNALAELDSRPRTGHPLAPHITITRDKSGLQQSVLKVPQWLREEWIDCEKSPISEKFQGNDLEYPNDWNDRGAADGNSNQPDSDFDEFSSQCSSTGDTKTQQDENEIKPIIQCKALYPYTPNLNDELALKPGDVLSVYRKQDDGWWLGECNGNVGIFPATYVEIIPV